MYELVCSGNIPKEQKINTRAERKTNLIVEGGKSLLSLRSHPTFWIRFLMLVEVLINKENNIGNPANKWFSFVLLISLLSRGVSGMSCPAILPELQQLCCWPDQTNEQRPRIQPLLGVLSQLPVHVRTIQDILFPALALPYTRYSATKL